MTESFSARVQAHVTPFAVIPQGACQQPAFGLAMREARREHDLPLWYVALETQLSERLLSRVERGLEPVPPWLATALAFTCGIDLAALTPPTPPPTEIERSLTIQTAREGERLAKAEAAAITARATIPDIESAIQTLGDERQALRRRLSAGWCHDRPQINARIAELDTQETQRWAQLRAARQVAFKGATV